MLEFVYGIGFSLKLVPDHKGFVKAATVYQKNKAQSYWNAKKWNIILHFMTTVEMYNQNMKSLQLKFI